MAGNGSQHKDDLRELKRLTNLYAQSRALPGIICLVILLFMIAGILLISRFTGGVLTMVEEPPWVTGAVYVTGAVFELAWCVLCVWLMFKGMKRYGPSFYRGEGQAVLRSEGIPIWAWALYLVTFIGPAVLSEEQVMPIRWALVTALASFGLFMLYAGRREKEAPLGVVYGGLVLIAAVATSVGLPTFSQGDWTYGYLVTLMTYIVGAGVITTIVVHLYNRRILRRLKGANPLGNEQ
jgi:uncharacterized membrane protein (DUF485 family)